MGILLRNEETPTNSSISSPAATFSKMSPAVVSPGAPTTRKSLKDVPMFVSQPTEMDVLCGQDKTFSTHPGNNLYRSMIAAWAQKYGQSTNKQSKMRMTTHICKVMKVQYKSRFLKPTPILMEHSNRIESEGSDVAAFRWTELTDQAARDKISHALRTSATASRRRLSQELRKKEKSLRERKKKEEKPQSAESQPKPQSDEYWMPQCPYHHNTRSFDSYFERPSDMWHWGEQKSALQNFEPLPMSSPAFYSPDYVALSASPLFVDDSEDEKSVAQSLLEKQQEIFRQLKEQQQTSSQTKSRSKQPKGRSPSPNSNP